jgi:hypothetical protein
VGFSRSRNFGISFGPRIDNATASAADLLIGCRCRRPRGSLGLEVERDSAHEWPSAAEAMKSRLYSLTKHLRKSSVREVRLPVPQPPTAPTCPWA